MTDPVFFAIREVAQSAYTNAMDQACVQCHSPIGSRTGELPWGPIDFENLPAVVAEGIGCDMCHTITGISDLSNGGVLLTPGTMKHGTISDPEPTPAHGSQYNRLYGRSEYCGACHDFVTDNGLELEATYREWLETGFHVTGKTCNDCHMPTYIGQAVPGGKERTLHSHTFPSVDLALVPFPQREEQRALTTELLQNALTLTVDEPVRLQGVDAMELNIHITNDLTGHSVPSGVPFNRQMWLEILVRDAQAATIYSSGLLEDNDDLMDLDRDPDLYNAQATMLRADGTPTGATWEATDLVNPSIAPGETTDWSYTFDIPANTVGPLQIEATLRFRSFPPGLFRDLGLEHLLPIPIFDMEGDTLTVDI
jgi:hypothetical protein